MRIRIASWWWVYRCIYTSRVEFQAVSAVDFFFLGYRVLRVVLCIKSHVSRAGIMLCYYTRFDGI